MALPVPRLDHLMFACSDLAACSAWLEQQTGVRPAFGGVHTGRGTHNALLSLGESKFGGPGVYLELIAPDPGQPDVDLSADSRFHFGPGGGGRLVHWAAITGNLAADQHAVGGSGSEWPEWKLTPPRAHSRTTPEERIPTLCCPPGQRPPWCTAAITRDSRELWGVMLAGDGAKLVASNSRARSPSACVRRPSSINARPTPLCRAHRARLHAMCRRAGGSQGWAASIFDRLGGGDR